MLPVRENRDSTNEKNMAPEVFRFGAIFISAFILLFARALAIGVGDKVNMLQYSTYSVISPEGCASILWKSAEKASTAAEVMGLTASRLKELNLIDSIVQEPLGGAHRNYAKMAENLKLRLKEDLAELDGLSKEELLNRRYERLMSYGYC